MSVLIDTWWNVNEEFTNYLREAGFSFNRYMVECELLWKSRRYHGI